MIFLFYYNNNLSLDYLFFVNKNDKTSIDGEGYFIEVLKYMIIYVLGVKFLFIYNSNLILQLTN